MKYRTIRLMFALLVSLCPGWGQSNVSAGGIYGYVIDPSGAAVPGAQVSLHSEQTGLARRVSTNGAGEYDILALPPGQYTVRIVKEGFRVHVTDGVRVVVGQVTAVDARLALGPTVETVQLAAELPLVESQRGQQSDTLEQEYVKNLPIDRRDYLSFTLLAPGVVDSKAMADNSDFRAKSTPDSGLSFYGSNGRGNSVTVDGGEANSRSGGVRPTLSQEAIEEFQVNRSNYSAELGGASGGVINIISKTGTNQLRGSLFGFFRHHGLDATNPFASVLREDRLVRTKPPARRQQFGGTLGMPLKEDRTFLFASAEGLRRRESSVVSVYTDSSIFRPTPAQERILGELAPSEAESLRRSLTSPPETIALFQRNSGVFPFSTNDRKFSVRLDHLAGESDEIFFRYNFTASEESNANIRALVGATRGDVVEIYDSTGLLGWTRTVSPDTVNEARLQFNYDDASTRSIEPFGPSLDIAGFGFFNRDFVLPTNTIDRRYEIRDHLTLRRGTHLLKIGAQFLLRDTHSNTQPWFAGSFAFGELPGNTLSPALESTTLTALQAFNLGLPQYFRLASGDPVVSAKIPYYGFFFQDHWRVNPSLTLDFGLRYEIDDRRDPLPTDTNNIAPRFSFAWNPWNDSKTVIRGGYGVFYSQIYYQIDWVANALNVLDGHRQIAQVFTTRATPGPAAADNVFRRLREQGAIGVPTPTRQVTPADVEPLGIAFTHDGPIPASSVFFENDRDYVNPYSQQASFGIERALPGDISLEASYVYVRTLKLPRARDKNLLAAPVDPALGIRVWSTPYFADPAIAQFNVYESTANAFYSGMLVALRKRFSRSLGLNANYTFSRATDEVVDFNSAFQANDQTDQRAERALSSFDQRHKVVVYGLWNGPAQFQIAPIFRYNSGRPFNLLVGSDLNRDRHSTADRPAGAGRNTGLGPSFWTFDLRASRKWALGESWRLELIGEGFNIFNRLNFATINNSGLGNIAPPFNFRGRHDRKPSEPLGFTSAFDARRFQLGVRLTF